MDNITLLLALKSVPDETSRCHLLTGVYAAVNGLRWTDIEEILDCFNDQSKVFDFIIRNKQLRLMNPTHLIKIFCRFTDSHMRSKILNDLISLSLIDHMRVGTNDVMKIIDAFTDRTLKFENLKRISDYLATKQQYLIEDSTHPVKILHKFNSSNAKFNVLNLILPVIRPNSINWGIFIEILNSFDKLDESDMIELITITTTHLSSNKCKIQNELIGLTKLLEHFKVDSDKNKVLKLLLEVICLNTMTTKMIIEILNGFVTEPFKWAAIRCISFALQNQGIQFDSGIDDILSNIPSQEGKDIVIDMLTPLMKRISLAN